ncbi:MAG: DUF362 domain-containing protein, partial [Spirochaetaceae bacterium]|nr:DUF362 domain-containing protein [Spirochaetaceae bacterium]
GIVASLAKHTVPDKACSACYGNLIHALKRLDELDKLNLTNKICIGQGYRGTSDKDLIGVGICTNNLGKTLKGCPPSASDMIEFLRNNSN